MARPDVKLLASAIVEEPLYRPVVPELRGLAVHQVEALHGERARGVDANAVELAGVTVGIGVILAPVVVTRVADEDFARGAARDLGDAWRNRGAREAGWMGRPGIAVGDRVAREMKPVASVVPPEGLVAGTQQVERRVRRDPAVLRAVGGHPDDGRFGDAVGGAVLHVGDGPRAGALRPTGTGSRERAAACRAGDQDAQRQPTGQPLPRSHARPLGPWKRAPVSMPAAGRARRPRRASTGERIFPVARSGIPRRTRVCY